MSFWSRKGRHQITPVNRQPVPEDHTHPIERVGLFATDENPHVGPPAPRPRRAWRKVTEQTAPYQEVHTPRTRQPRPAAGPEPIPVPRPYIPVPPALSAVREFELLTARASDFKFPLTCGCGHEHKNLNADTFRDLYISAEQAGWQQDLYGTWRCPRCARRHEAWFGVRPVAAIEAAA